MVETQGSAAPGNVAPAGAQLLKQGVGLVDLVMLGAGTAIGAAVFTVLGPAAQVGREGLLFGIALAALPMVIFGLVYAYLASALPRTAASFEWQRTFTHPLIAFVVIWMRILANVGVLIILAKVLVNYLGMVLPLPPKLSMAGFFLVVFALNVLGVTVAARAQSVLMILLIVVFAIFVTCGAPHWRSELFSIAALNGWRPILLVTPLMIQLFLGIETVTEVGEEVRNARVVVPSAIALALLLTVVLYSSVAFTALSLQGAAGLAASKAPLLTAAEVALGPWAKPLIITAAVLALLKSMNAVFLVFSRFLYAMGKAQVLPAPLAHVHPRFRTPDVATVIAFTLTLSGLFFPDSLLFLLLAINVPTMLKYFGTSLAAFNVATRWPQVRAQARLPFPPALVASLGLLGMAAAAAIAALGFSTDWRPYVLLAGWLTVGLIYYALSARRRSARPRHG